MNKTLPRRVYNQYLETFSCEDVLIIEVNIEEFKWETGWQVGTHDQVYTSLSITQYIMRLVFFFFADLRCPSQRTVDTRT